jgi:hypothetical protein
VQLRMALGLAAIAIVAGGCGLSVPTPGRCSLRLFEIMPGLRPPDPVELREPYVATVPRFVAGEPLQGAVIGLAGEGWIQPTVDVIDPAGNPAASRMTSIHADLGAASLVSVGPQPGVWGIRLKDAGAGCGADLSIRVAVVPPA